MCESTFSGKSAIVAAIQLCLGATAKTTGRGSKLNTLIREGSNGPAIMRVTLLNEGADAYKPESYGSRIVVERKISKDGASSYQLLDREKMVLARWSALAALADCVAGGVSREEGAGDGAAHLQHLRGQPLLRAHPGGVQEVHPRLGARQVRLLPQGVVAPRPVLPWFTSRRPRV